MCYVQPSLCEQLTNSCGHCCVKLSTASVTWHHCEAPATTVSQEVKTARRVRQNVWLPPGCGGVCLWTWAKGRVRSEQVGDPAANAPGRDGPRRAAAETHRDEKRGR